jgi:hypothetical protein
MHTKTLSAVGLKTAWELSCAEPPCQTPIGYSHAVGDRSSPAASEDSERMTAERARAVKASKVKLDALGFACWNPRRAGPSRTRGSGRRRPLEPPSSARYAWRGALGSDGTRHSDRGASRSGFCRHRCAGGVSAGRVRRSAVRRRPVVRRHRARGALATGAPLGPLAARPFR